jgi:hypothetical protein
MTFYNLTRLVEPLLTGFADTTNPLDVPTNADVADHVHAQGGHVTYTHPITVGQGDAFLPPYTAKALPVDVALGKIDSLDINYGGWDGTLAMWYRLLNCGFRLPASAGTDAFLNRLSSRVPGGARAYVKVAGPFSYATWVAGLKAGRSFATDGPMLELSAADKSIGDTIRLAAPGGVAVKASCRLQFPIERAELIHSGKAVLTATLAADKLSATIDQTVAIERTGWIALRCLAGPDTEISTVGTVQAHTSPIYIDVAGRPAQARADAEYLLVWIDRLQAKLRQRDRVPEAARAGVAAQLGAARAIYRRIANQAP